MSERRGERERESERERWRVRNGKRERGVWNEVEREKHMEKETMMCPISKKRKLERVRRGESARERKREGERDVE